MTTDGPLSDSTESMLERGRTLLVAHQYDRAKQVIAGLIPANPDNARMWRLMALAHLGSKDYAEALDAANRALALDPQNADMHLMLARVLIASDRIREGVDAAANALRIKPDSVDAHLLIARGLAQVRQELGSAVWHAHRAIELEPDSARTHYALGSALSSSSDRRRRMSARQALETALRIDPQHDGAWNDLGRIELARRRPARAARAFVTSLEIDPQSSAPAHNLPLAMWLLVARGWFWSAGLLLLTLFVLPFGAAFDEESIVLSVVGHVIFVAMVASMAWWISVRRLLRVFPRTMRTAAWRVLRHDRLVRPIWLGVAWLGLVQIVAVAVPWGLDDHTGNAFLAGYGLCLWLGVPGYWIGRLVSLALVLRSGNEQAAKRRQQWQAVVAPPPPR